MRYCFRLRFDLEGWARIASAHRASTLVDTEQERVTVNAHPAAGGAESSVLVEGRSYPSADVARRAGLRWSALVQRAFAHLNVGADLGARKMYPTPFRMESGGGRLAESGLLIDEPGITVFEEEPWPTFVRQSSSSSFARSLDVLVEAISAAQRLDAPLSPEEQTTYDLYSSSFSATSVDARFIVLMMALETLISPRSRDERAVAHVDRPIELTRQAGLSEGDSNSLIGSLRFLQRESIGRAGRRLVSALGGVIWT